MRHEKSLVWFRRDLRAEDHAALHHALRHSRQVHCAFVLDTACRQFMQWRQALGPLAPQALSVNLSRAQLADPDLPAQVQRSLQASGMPAAALQLEVTESLAAQDALVRSQLQALQALGLGLALDDFGTGYSSLSSLHQLPVGVVKIDRSFVSQLETSAHHRALVKATVDVAQSLGMGTVAEGIETALAASELFEVPVWSCVSAQGIESFEPPAGVREVIVFADNDANFAGQAAAYRAAHRLKLKGFEVEVVVPEIIGDWLDVLRLRATEKSERNHS